MGSQLGPLRQAAKHYSPTGPRFVGRYRVRLLGLRWVLALCKLFGIRQGIAIYSQPPSPTHVLVMRLLSISEFTAWFQGLDQGS